MGKPILTSNLPFAYNICHNAAKYFDPLDPKSIGESIVNLAKDKKLQEELIKRGYKMIMDFGTAKDRTSEYLDILKYITNK